MIWLMDEIVAINFSFSDEVHIKPSKNIAGWKYSQHLGEKTWSSMMPRKDSCVIY